MKRSNPAVLNTHPTSQTTNPTGALKLLLTPQEAADALSLDRSTLYLLMMRGEFPSIKIGRSRRIKVKDLEQWIDDQVAA